jgi:CheY-like chemotaxis protein
MEKRVLVIDDNPLVRTGVAAMLKQHAGVDEVAVAKNGKEGMQKVRSFRPDLVITDLMMPTVRGVELLGRLDGDVPCVVYSSLSRGSLEAQMALAAGAAAFVQKPKCEAQRADESLLSTVLELLEAG